jgi:hypothetical protein
MPVVLFQFSNRRETSGNPLRLLSFPNTKTESMSSNNRRSKTTSTTTTSLMLLMLLALAK